MRRLIFLNAWFILLGLAYGCTSSQITHSWKADKTALKDFRKILVVGINAEKDRAMREEMEEHLVGDLRDLGYDAYSSLGLFGPKAFREMNEESVLDSVRKSGFDGAITIVLLDKSRERHYVPARVHYSPYIIYHRRFWGYYVTMYDRIYTPGYYSENTRFFWESNLYDLESKELIYSVQTESFDPGNRESLAHQYGKLIVSDMVKKHVLRSNEQLTNRSN